VLWEVVVDEEAVKMICSNKFNTLGLFVKQ
jgi:hypothetical protein